MVFSAVLTAVVDALNGTACVIASAMTVALSYPLIIPSSVVMQWFINGIAIRDWGVSGWIGTVLVVAGVFCLETPEEDIKAPCTKCMEGDDAESDSADYIMAKEDEKGIRLV